MEELSKISTKMESPRVKANVISKLFFCWTFPLFRKGLKKDLNEDDLYAPLKQHDSGKLGYRLENVWKIERLKKRPSLVRVLFKIFGLEITFYGIVLFIQSIGFRVSQPILLAKLMAFFVPNQTTVSKDEAFMYASLIVGTRFIQTLCEHTMMINLLQLGMRMRIATCSMIYRKAVKLSRTSIAATTIGQMVNLLSNDVNRFDHAMIRIHDIWLCPLEAIVFIYLLYDFGGVAAMTGVLFLVMLFPFFMFLTRKFSVLRRRTALRTDERIRLMNEIICGIQVIKMYTWEKPFAKLIDLARGKELAEIRRFKIYEAVLLSFNSFMNRMVVYFCLLTYILLGNKPNPQYVYVLSAYYGQLRQSIINDLTNAIRLIAELQVSISRVEKFLSYDEVVETPQLSELPQEININKTLIDLNNVSAKWDLTSPSYVLDNINFKVNTGELIAVIGPVGSGKSSFFQLLLKELPICYGKMNINGIISYASQDPWLFDGSIRQNIIFSEPYIAEKYAEVVRVCALQYDFDLFPYGDKTLVGERGVTLSGGQKARVNLARAVYKEADIYILDDPLSAVDTNVGKQLFSNCISTYLKTKSTILITHQIQYLNQVDRIYLIENGKITASGSSNELKNFSNKFTELLQNHSNEEEDELIDDVKKKEKLLTNEPINIKEQRSLGKVNRKVYSDYFRSGGSLLICFFLLFLFVINQVLASGIDLFLAFWVNLEEKRDERLETIGNSTENSWEDIYLTEINCIYIYTLLVLLLIVAGASKAVLFFKFCLRASAKLHNLMYNRVILGKMRFFTTNASGRILNRFAKDVGSLDERLPHTVLDTLAISIVVISTTIVVSSINPWILLPAAVIGVILYFLRIIFISSSRNIKRMEAITRSPIYTHLSASLHGIVTIRALNAQNILIDEFDRIQNDHSSVFALMIAANRAFALWLDLHCLIFTALVTFSFLITKNVFYGGDVGLSITQALSLTGTLQWGVRQWSELENQMTSAERVLEYTELDIERTEVVKTPAKTWPEFGQIVFDSVYLQYSEEEPFVLKNLNFTINAGEKIGIVGRTGAGKSSLIYALFRLTEVGGSILIDNCNTKYIPLNVLRSKISIIPQEPVIFSGTLRKNLDPFDEYDDSDLWKALDEVEMKGVVADYANGLNSAISESGSNLSIGQRQLICLARAIIKNNKIIVLDEATANIDPQTDLLIQKTIRNKFSQCTVLTIAHRLHTIMDSDKVLVMDSGSAVEFDHPYNLLKDSKGTFFELVSRTGFAFAQNLTEIAKKSYQSQKDK